MWGYGSNNIPTVFLLCEVFFCWLALLPPVAFCDSALVCVFCVVGCWGLTTGLGPFLRCVVVVVAAEVGPALGTVVAEVLGPRLLLGAAAASGSDSDDPLEEWLWRVMMNVCCRNLH